MSTQFAGDISELRARLIRLAYQLVGSAPEAEDVVQEAFLRWHQAGGEHLRNPWSYLATVVSRIGLDHLRSAQRRRERHVGTWLPAPLVEQPTDQDPADHVVLDESIQTAVLVVLESLSPAERVVFVLHDVFALPYPEISRIVGRSPAACRQLGARARAHVRGGAPRFSVDPAEHSAVVSAFSQACSRGDVDALLRLLDDNVTVRADGGSVTAARRPVRGAAKVATYLSRILRKWPVTLCPAVVGGAHGLLAECDRQIVAAVSITVHSGLIVGVDIVVDPVKLAHIPLAVPVDERISRKRGLHSPDRADHAVGGPRVAGQEPHL